MKKYILIQNDGEIETNSFELIGASTKRDDETKIGFFGSGLKYSIAFMMRNGIDFKIFSGTTPIKFSTKAEILKDKSFDRICINGVATSYTTTMGPTWEHQWFVLREIYCNAIDEGSCTLVKSTEIVEPSEGKTRIYIELTDTLQEVITKWDAYFSDEREPLFITEEKIYTSYLSNKADRQTIKVYDKTNGSLFRKGVKVWEDEKTIFDYEMDHIDINEDRTAKNAAAIGYGFVSMASNLSNEGWLLSILRQEESKEYLSLRGVTNYETVSDKWVQFSNDYMLVVKEVSGKYSNQITESRREVLLIPEYFAFSLKKKNQNINILGMGRVLGDLSMEEIQPTAKMEFLLKEVTNSLSEMGYEVPFDIHVAEFKSERTMGSADIQNKRIYIADKTFDMGRREIAMTIMEECEHIRSGAEDETREFQTHIFSKWLTYMEEKSALFL